MSNAARLYFITYDISCPQRWRRVQTVIKGICRRNQLSVFFCRATPARIRRMAGLVEVDEASLPFRAGTDPVAGGAGRSHQGKRHMRKFNGVPKESFGLFLKECEWRFNNPKPKSQLKQLKQWAKEYLN